MEVTMTLFKSYRNAISITLLVSANVAFAQDITPEADPGTMDNQSAGEMAHKDQSGFATPEQFRFSGHMASVWSKQDLEDLVQDTPVTLPLMIHPPAFFEECVYVWDAWPVRNPDGSVAVIDDWVVMVGLSAEWDEVEETGWEFFTLSTWRYWYTRDGEWRPGGIVLDRTESMGSRQWAGSTFYDEDSQTVTLLHGDGQP